MSDNTPLGKNFKQLVIVFSSIEILLVLILYFLKHIILIGEYSFGHSVYQAYTYYTLLIIGIVVLNILSFFDYKFLIQNNLTTPRRWKKLYLIIMSIISSFLTLIIVLM